MIPMFTAHFVREFMDMGYMGGMDGWMHGLEICFLSSLCNPTLLLDIYKKDSFTSLLIAWRVQVAPGLVMFCICYLSELGWRWRINSDLQAGAFQRWIVKLRQYG